MDISASELLVQILLLVSGERKNLSGLFHLVLKVAFKLQETAVSLLQTDHERIQTQTSQSGRGELREQGGHPCSCPPI